MGHQDNGSSSTYAKLNVIMNLALLWILTFVILFRGLHNCGRIINFLVIFPLVLFVFVTIRFIEEFGDGIIYLFFSNGKVFLGDSMVSSVVSSWYASLRRSGIRADKVSHYFDFKLLDQMTETFSKYLKQVNQLLIVQLLVMRNM